MIIFKVMMYLNQNLNKLQFLSTLIYHILKIKVLKNGFTKMLYIAFNIRSISYHILGHFYDLYNFYR